MKKETLTFLRNATKKKDGKNGFIFVNSWDTGYQELIFNSMEDAEKVKSNLNTPEHIKFLKTPA